MNLYWINKLGSIISLVGAIGLVNINFAEPTLAQIQPDTTLGLESSTLLLNGDTTNNSSGELIIGGARRGSNLFHSFENFNINNGQIIYFDSSSGITRIFSRITGDSPSYILGTLGVWDNLNHQLGNADLFLINPNGILFGRDARLDLGGSFITSTASSIIFADGTEFSASNPSNSSLLTISIPIGLQFRTKVGAIRDQSSELAVEGGRTLALIGGEVTLDREAWIHSGSDQEAGGRIELGGVGANERVNLQAIPTGWALSYENVQAFADIELLSRALINAHGGAEFGSGEVQIQGRNISFVERAQVTNFNAGTQPGGKIVIRASETLNIEKRDPISGIESAVGNLTESSGRAGDIEITARNLRLFDGASITTQVISGSGRGGNITINVTELAELRNGVFLTTSTFGQGNAGDLTILAKDLRVLGGSEISASTGGQGRGGNITINASSIEVSGFSLVTGRSSIIEVQSQEGATAPGGNLSINTNSLRITDGAIINAATSTNARGGNIAINTNTLGLVNGGQIFSSTFSNGEAGNITINASNNIFLSGQDTNFIARLNEFGREKVENIGVASGIFANTELNVSGNGGSIFLQTPQLTIQNNAEISVSSQGIGNAGNLTLNSNFLTLDNQGKLTASSQSGEGGNITLNVQDTLLLRNNSFISATAGGTGNGGNIDINANFLVAFPNENSDITANAFGGQGGEINIIATGVFGLAVRDQLTADNDITAFSQLEPALNGIITLNTPEIDPSRGLLELPETVINPNTLIAQNPCKKGTQSELTVTGRGGLPPNPTDDLNPQATQVDLIEPAPTVETEGKQKDFSNTSSFANPIIPAQGWTYNAKGEIVLTAYNPSVTESQRRQTNPDGCPVP